MQRSTAKFALQSVLEKLDLKKIPTPFPVFFNASQYKPLGERSNAVHVAVKDVGVDVYEYSSDMRESPCTTTAYDSLTAFVRAFATTQIDHAATIYTATTGKAVLQRALNGGNPMEFVEMRGKFVANMTLRLDAYLISDEFLTLLKDP